MGNIEKWEMASVPWGPRGSIHPQEKCGFTHFKNLSSDVSLYLSLEVRMCACMRVRLIMFLDSEVRLSLNLALQLPRHDYGQGT